MVERGQLIADSLSRQRDREHQFRENAGRQATAYVTYTTTGVGDTVLDSALALDTKFVEEPSVSTGVQMTRPPNNDYFQLPRATAGVYRWQRDDRGFYVGAFLYFAVDCPVHPEFFFDQSLPEPKPRLIHYLRFTGLSYKQIGGDAMAELEGEVNPNLLPRVS